MRVFGETDADDVEGQGEIDPELFKRRIVQVGDIDGNGGLIASQIYLLDSKDSHSPIWLWIQNSPGGEMYELFCIYDMMHLVKAPVYTICYGLAASSAAVLLAAGHKGHRYITPNSYVMIHQVQVENISGTGTQVALEAKESKRMSNRMAEMLARHTGQGLAKVKRDYEHDHYLDANGALEYGLVDHIVQFVKPIPGLRKRRKPKPKDPPPKSQGTRQAGEKAGEKEPESGPANNPA
jgi:ATP-dependent Clp protease protease subunit